MSSHPGHVTHHLGGFLEKLAKIGPKSFKDFFSLRRGAKNFDLIFGPIFAPV